jgi:hypothetical protein
MQRAIEIAERNGGTISDWGKGGGVPGEDYPDFSPEDLLRNVHREPFWQGAPSKSCDNPDCTAEIAYRRESITIPADDVVREVTGLDFLTMEACDVRRDSMRVFAIHEPDKHDRIPWGNTPLQLIFEVCECCHCIRVSNQCG